MKTLIILDNGHGGIINGKYQTKGKRSPVWQDGSQLYEGVFNRQIVDGIANELDKLNIPFEILVPEDKDISLHKRAERANLMKKPSVLISVHSNAGGGEGVEIFTSPGETKSDKIATVFGEEFKREFPEYKLRTDYVSDGDLDKEAKFTILVKTQMPAVLTENFFMDNELECRKILMNAEQRKRIVKWHVKAIQRVITENLI